MEKIVVAFINAIAKIGVAYIMAMSIIGAATITSKKRYLIVRPTKKGEKK